jgi:hypothetical protein
MHATRFYYGVLRSPHSGRPWQVIGVSRRDLFVQGNFKSRTSARAKANELNGCSVSAVVDSLEDANCLLDSWHVENSTGALWKVFSAPVDPKEKPHSLITRPVQKHWRG